MDQSKDIHERTAVNMENASATSRGTSPSRSSGVATGGPTSAQAPNNGKKIAETLNNSKSGRRRSPVPSKKYGEKNDKVGSSSTGGVSSVSTHSGLQGNSSSSYLIPTATSNLTLPVTPSTQSLLSVTDEKSHNNLQSTISAPTGTIDSSSVSGSATSKPTEDASNEDDADASYFSNSGERGNPILDEMDGAGGSLSISLGTPEYNKVRLEMEQIHVKVNRTRELIRDEQTARDENVNEYLRLASQADKQQQTRLKAVFEKKNTKSAQQMQLLQRKLDTYQRRLKSLEAQGVPRHHGHRAPKEVLRGVGIGIKTVMSKPREFAHLIRNKFGSADNISHIRAVENTPCSSAPEDSLVTSQATVSTLSAGNSNSLPGHGVTSQQIIGQTSIVPAASQGSGGGKYTSEEGSECGSSVTSESMAGGLHMSPRHNVVGTGLGLSMGLESFFQELQERREEVERLREEMEQVKLHLQQEVSFVSAALQEERFRVERLEEQINDLTELHQNEVENLKQNIADMEEKVQYQSEERLRDIHDLLESCHTRISKVEHQAQHQQHVSLEGIENSNARAVLVKLINMALTLLQLLLVVVSTSANIIAPFLQTRSRVYLTVLLAVAFAIILKKWPDIEEIGSHLIQHYKTALRS